MDKKIFQKTSAFFFCILFSILPIIKGNLLASCNTNDLAIKTDHSEVVDDGKKCSREHTNTRILKHTPACRNTSQPKLWRAGTNKGSVVSYFVIEGDTILIDTLDPLVDLKMSLSTFMLAVNLIDQMRTGYKSEQSKFFLGEKGKGTYEKSTRVAMKLYEVTGNASYKKQAFTFSEKSKAGVLLTALRDSEARQFAGLSDSLVEYERTLKIDLAFYDKMLAEEQQKGKEADSAKIALWSDKLFVLKQKYAVLLDVLESQYPDYYDLKYRTRTLTVKEVQNNLLDDNTALIAYATSEIDTCVYIYTVTKNNYTAKIVKVDTLFYEWIKRMRNGIYKKRFPLYVHWAYPIYKTLVEPVVNQLKNSTIKNLIIVPEGLLGYVPFEALLTKEVDENKEDYTALPYLVNDYTISYGYSATLLLDQRNKIKKQSAGNFTAFAPVDFNDQYYEEMVRGGLGNISSL
ncbi:MAG: CHAT domain-containing protein, partial [Bacteroidetes bacterium]|nr:CHAT domain-containing protein [Bacteroidota bacterium]